MTAPAFYIAKLPAAWRPARTEERMRSPGAIPVPLSIFIVALAVRLAFVLWAPGEPTGDGFFYHLYAYDLVAGNGYVNVDRSPANTWMPGWPALLAAFYAVFGVHAKAAMAVNAVLGAATCALVAALGARLVSARIGGLAGALLAVWPGHVYFAATLFTEPLFSALFYGALLLQVEATRAADRRLVRFGAAGLALGGAAMVKAEPLVMAAPLALHLLVAHSDRRDALRATVVTFGLAAAVVAPWTLRNWLVFDRFIPTSAGGGMIVYAANHAGASGGNDLRAILDYAEALGVSDLTQAEQNIAMNDHGWADARRFAREEPLEMLRILGSKLRLTYTGDSAGAEIVRGYFGPDRWHLDRATWRALARVADAWWWAMVGLAAIGLTRVPAWARETRVLVFGVWGTWIALHLVFLGGMRFHVPETGLMALLAAEGLDRIRSRLARGRDAAAHSSP